ncbi:MAG TPA: serine/threonine-protein kinase, partial [Longimicrobiales bacterium]
MTVQGAAMDERWIRVRALFESACALPHYARAELLAACADTALRAEVATLLEAHDRIATGPAGSFLTRLDPQRTAVLLSDAGAAADVASGEMIGRYRVVRVLGRGGMGVVYLAHDPRLDRSVALKLLPPHLGMDATARQRFENEAKAASALDHPNIVTVYEIGDTPDGSIFIAMAFCEGTTLRDMLDAGPLPVPRAIELTTQIAHGLAAAHRRGIVHRDIKPGNIMVAADGTARIVDFGVAKTGSGAPVEPGLTPGTVAYMSPEQTRGSEVDARSDVWSLGVVLYEML